MGRINRTFSTAALLSLLSYLPTSLGAIAAERLSICVTNKSGDVFTNLSVGKVLGDGLLLENSAGQFTHKGKWVDVHISTLSDAKTADKIFAEFQSQLSYGD